MADGLVCCHAAGREAVHGYESFSLRRWPTTSTSTRGSRRPSTRRVSSPARSTPKTSTTTRPPREAVTDFGDEAGVPAADPVRDGAGRIVDGIVEEGAR